MLSLFFSSLNVCHHICIGCESYVFWSLAELAVKTHYRLVISLSYYEDGVTIVHLGTFLLLTLVKRGEKIISLVK